MSDAWRSRLGLGLVLLTGAALSCAGITWGLPSSEADAYLFGGRDPWPGQKILELAGGWDADAARGADVDINALQRPAGPVELNRTDADRAAIIRRYRLYSCQPDEMITLRALASMRPGEGRLDPKLYQYGGLWIYPVGAMLKAAALAGLVTVKADVAWYLDHPEEFGRFYVVARVYSAAWGLVALWAVYWLVRRLAGSVFAATMAGLTCAALPVMINMAHEAKPHLPGAALQLLAVAAAVRFVDSGRRRWWVATAVLCGAAFAMVLSAWPVFIILPVMAMLRSEPPLRRARIVFGGGLIGAAVYLAANPYIAINWFVNREVLTSNFGNSLAMYEIGRWPEGLANAARLIVEGTFWPVAVVGAAALPFLARRARAGWLLAAPALLILAQFVALAAGKPGEYGRFAVLPDVALVIAAVMGLHARLPWPHVRHVLLTTLLIGTALRGQDYLRAFMHDAGSNNTRSMTALFVAKHNYSEDPLVVTAEPAPYCLPPVDLFRFRLVLDRTALSSGGGATPGVIVTATDQPARLQGQRDRYVVLSPWWNHRTLFGPTLISWADKPLVVLQPDTEERPPR